MGRTAKIAQRRMLRVLLERCGTTFAQEIGIRLQNKPAPLFQLLFSALLLSARIPSRNAVRAARALIESGLTTPDKMARASWQDRVDVITWHGYKRYDERTSTMLGDTAERLIANYQASTEALSEPRATEGFRSPRGGAHQGRSGERLRRAGEGGGVIQLLRFWYIVSVSRPPSETMHRRLHHLLP